jgi:hypothetical protein
MNLTQHNDHRQSMSEYSHEAVPCGHQYVPVLRRIFHIQTQQNNASCIWKIKFRTLFKGTKG